MTDIAFTITDAGRAAIVAAGGNGTLPVHITQAGVSATAVTASPTATTLPGEIKRIAISSGNAVSPDTIHLIVRDESNSAYSVNSIALYLSDGTMFAIYGQSTAILSKSASAILLLAADIRFAAIAASSIAFGNTDFLNPPATTTQQGVVALATTAESQEGLITTKAVTPAGGKASVLNWLGYTPVNKAGDLISGSLSLTPGNVLSVNSGSGYGGIQLVRGDAGTGGYVNIYAPNNTYLGYGLRGTLGGAVAFTNTQGGGFGFSGGFLTRDGSRVWDAGNDGAGSGLDADMLDGIDSGAFARRDQVNVFTDSQTVSRQGPSVALNNTGAEDSAYEFRRNGVIRWNIGDSQGNACLYINLFDAFGAYQSTPFRIDINNAIATFDKVPIAAGSTIWAAGNDGSGSGLDADMLDGRDSSYFLAAGNYYAGDVLAKLVTVDGSGSGLDADMLDGRHASDFALNSGFQFGSNANGYWQKGPDGVIEQWGKLPAVSAAGGYSFYFPIQFTDADSVNIQLTGINLSNASSFDCWPQAGDHTTDACNWTLQWTNQPTTSPYLDGVFWRAKGR